MHLADSNRVYEMALGIVRQRLADVRLLENEYSLVVLRDRQIDHTADQSQLPEHRCRNRYINVLPYDYNCVKISTSPGELRSAIQSRNYTPPRLVD